MSMPCFRKISQPQKESGNVFCILRVPCSSCMFGRGLLFVLILSLTSCSEKRYDPVPLYPVSGLFTYQDEPVAGAFVKFTPINKADNNDVLTAQAVTDAEGVFTLSTYEKNDGAPAGHYVVTLVWPEASTSPMKSQDPGPDRLNYSYADPKKAKWTIEITEGNNVLKPFVIDPPK